MTREKSARLEMEARLRIDGYVMGLDAPDDDIERAVGLDEEFEAEFEPKPERFAAPEFTDDEIDAHVEMALAA